jgi:hypothetical protein
MEYPKRIWIPPGGYNEGCTSWSPAGTECEPFYDLSFPHRPTLSNLLLIHTPRFLFILRNWERLEITAI